MNLDTPAFRLLCACCRWPANQDKADAVAEAAKSPIDWDQFKVLVQFHRVHGLVYAALGSVDIPSDLRKWLASEARGIATDGLLQAHETTRLATLFAQAGIPALAFKGIALGLHVYGGLSMKQSRDIDMMVPPDQIATALTIAEAHGYSLVEPAAKLTPNQIAAIVRYRNEFCLRSNQGVLLEIHPRLVENAGLLKAQHIDWEGQQISFGPGRVVTTLTDADLFAYLCVHGAHHFWARIKWLADLNALLARCGSDAALAQYNSKAIEMGAKWPALLAQMLCAELFGRPLPEYLIASAATGRAKALKAYCLQSMDLPARGKWRSFTRETNDALMSLKLGAGWHFWLGFLRSYLVGDVIILELNLRQRWIFLYPLIRPFFWLWFRWISPRGRYRLGKDYVDSRR